MGSLESPRIVVGIDFGTTFSGFVTDRNVKSVLKADDDSIAWALDDCPDDIEVIQTWPAGGNNTSQKAPTVLSYHDAVRLRWGYQVTDSTNVIRGVKLLLDETQVFRYQPATASQAVIERLKKSPVEVSGEYLKMLVEHAREILNRRFRSALDSMELHYILTVPAVWSDKAKDATLQAACLANIPKSNLTLLSEPEAAAVYAIRTIQPNTMANGDCFIVCDAGGGTVDLITYCIKQSNPMRLEEVTEGTGAVCGSVILDEQFEAFLARAVGEKTYWKLPQDARDVAMDRWRNYIKPNYSGPLEYEGFADAGYSIPIPGAASIQGTHRSEGFVLMECNDILAIFDSVVQQILPLIARQRLKVKEAGLSTKAIILVGGLGASEYLFKQVQNEFRDIQVMQPLNAWSAVVRGAVFRGQEGNQVDNRKARCHYGVQCRQQFDPDIHGKDAEQIWCPYEEEWQVNNRMKWYIRKGETVSENQPIKVLFYRAVRLSDSLVFKDTLHFCQTEKTPRAKDSSVTQLCEVEADLSKIPKQLFEKHVNSRGKEYYKISYNLVLTPTSASLLFELEFNGISYGLVRSRY